MFDAGLSSIQSDEQVWYFYCILDRKYAKSERPSRTAKGGSWKKTGIDRLVKAKDGNKQIGIKKTLVFYNGSNTRKENKTSWTMHEYHEYPCKKNSRFKVYDFIIYSCFGAPIFWTFGFV